MPGLFGFLKKMVQGKPIYESTDQAPTDVDQSFDKSSAEASPVASQPTNPIQKGNASTFPVVRVRHVDCRLNGTNTEVYAHIANESPGRIILDRIRGFGTERRITDDLRAGEEHPYLIYAGPALASQQNRDAYLLYRTDTGDYFEARHDVSYMFHNDTKTYSINELRLHPPIRDIYG